MKNTVIKLRSRLDANVIYNIETAGISKILDYLVVLNNGRMYNVVETTSEIIEKISNACDTATETELKSMTSKELFEGLGIDLDETFESIFGFRPEDDISTVAKKLTGGNKKKRRVRKIVNTPFGPISAWVDEEE